MNDLNEKEMKEFFIKEHSSFCPCNTPTEKRIKPNLDSPIDEFSYRSKYLCEKNIEIIIFLHQSDFYFVKINSCMIPQFGNTYDFIVYLLKSSFTAKKKIGFVRKSQHYNDVFKEMRKDFFNMGNRFLEVNFIYSDNSGKEYSIISEIEFSDFLDESFEVLKKNYQSAKEYLIKHKQEHYLGDIKDLYYANFVRTEDDKFYLNTVNDLIKQLNKKTNGNSKESNR